MSKYGVRKYSPEMDQVVIDEFSEGKSIVEICQSLGIARDTFYRWTDPDDEHSYQEDFADAVEFGKTLSEAWWTAKGREYLVEYKDSGKMNASLYIINMKNRFGWTDRQETTSTVSLNHSVDRETLSEFDRDF